jgi:hypothetical protein
VFEAFLFLGVALLIPGSLMVGFHARVDQEMLKRETALIPIGIALLALLLSATIIFSLVAFVLLAALALVAGVGLAVRLALVRDVKYKWLFPLAIALQIGGAVLIALAVSFGTAV